MYELFVCLRNFLPHFLLPYTFFLIYLLLYLFTYLPVLSRIDPFRFQAGGRRRRPSLALVICYFYDVVVYFVTDAKKVCFCCV